MRVLSWFLAGFLCLSGSFAASADSLPALEGPVLLTVTASDGAVAEFDRGRLEGLDWREIETHTSFTDGPQVFAGPTLASVLAHAGIDGGTLDASAVNGYTVPIPVAHAAAHDVLLAMDWNGQAMRIRTKGPIWVVYPLDADEVAGQPFDSEMIWQLTNLSQQG